MTHRLIGLFAAVALALAAPMSYAHHKAGHVNAGAGNGSEWVVTTVCNPRDPRDCETVCLEVDPGNSGKHNNSPESTVPPKECQGGPAPS